MDLTSKDGQEIMLTFDKLDESRVNPALANKHRRRNAGRTSSSRAGRMTDGLVPPDPN
jgi:hypothetical protein